MVSLIDFSKPVYGTPTTQSVRDNFQIAQTEITDLQQFIANGPFLPLHGGTMTGKLELWRHPVSNLEAATKQYVDDIAFAGGGMPDAPKDGFYYVRGGGETTQATENEWVTDPAFTSLRIWDANKVVQFGLYQDATYNYYDLKTGGPNHFRFNRANNLLELIIAGQLNSGFSDTVITFNRHIVSSAGLDFGSQTGAANNDTTKHITLHAAGYGIGITAFRQNYYASGASHVFMTSPTADTVTINSSGLLMGPATAITLVADPTTALHAASKQYVDSVRSLVTGSYLPLSGGALTGNISINASGTGNWSQISFDKTPGLANAITTQANGLNRWQLRIGDHSAESGGNTGSDFTLTSFTDAGAGLETPFYIIRATGLAFVKGDPTSAMGIATKQYVDTKAGQYLPLTGGTVTGVTNFSAPGVAIGVTNQINVGALASNAIVYIGHATATQSQLLFDAVAGTERGVVFRGDGLAKFIMRIDGANSGLSIDHYNDAGGYVGSSFYIDRATGLGYVKGDPTAATGIATKQYVDGKVGGAGYLPLTGGTIAGDLSVFPGSLSVAYNVIFGFNGAGYSAIYMNSAPNTNRITYYQSNGSTRWLYGTSAGAESGGDVGSDFFLSAYTDAGGGGRTALYFSRATGLGTVAGDPTTALGIATKQYVDGKVGGVGYLPLTGGILTGPLSMGVAAPATAKARTIQAEMITIPYSNGGIGANVFVDNVGGGAWKAIANGAGWMMINGATDTWQLSTWATSTAGATVVGVGRLTFDSRGSLALNCLAPQAQALPNAQGGWAFGWGLTFNNWAGNAYYDGTNWKYLTNGFASQIEQSATGTINFCIAVTGLKDAVCSMVTRATMDSNGNLTIPGTMKAKTYYAMDVAGYPQYRFENTGAPVDAKKSTIYMQPDGGMAWQFESDDSSQGSQFFIATRSGFATSAVALTATTINLTGVVWGGDVHCRAYYFKDSGGYIYGDANIVAWTFDTGMYRVQFARSNSLFAYVRGSDNANLWYVDSGGSMVCANQAWKPGGGSWADSSDIRTKRITGDYKLGLNEILNLNPIKYTFRGNDKNLLTQQTNHLDTTKEYIGLAAQEVEKHFPEMVSKQSAMIDDIEVDDLRVLDLSSLPLALVNAVKELYARIVTLETQLATRS